jgi:hypothetical protein
LVVVGADRFFLTNTIYFENNQFLSIVEIGMQLNLGSVIYFDGKKAIEVERLSAFPSGIAVDAKRQYLYVASMLSEVGVIDCLTSCS